MMQQTNHARLLYLVKQFYLEAINLAAVGDDLSAMKAVLFLDLSIEQVPTDRTNLPGSSYGSRL